ncbi:uncharacterized protein VP01_1869g2 [Puccinia sorghi]|uniref:Uncharacterized protein n=1 Tax=Puccinia sorghi TaxID=27349 RepID=A0A0L6VD93_9BASI|nr:uncharacterized protein VP01_1869g2 [Puccinia sorghi]
MELTSPSFHSVPACATLIGSFSFLPNLFPQSIKIKLNDVNQFVLFLLRLYYPVSILQSIFDDFPGHKFAVYNLGCHLEAHLKKVCACFNIKLWLMKLVYLGPSALPSQNSRLSRLNPNTTQKKSCNLQNKRSTQLVRPPLLGLPHISPKRYVTQVQSLEGESELLLKVWYTKTKLRRRFLALIEEK